MGEIDKSKGQVTLDSRVIKAGFDLTRYYILAGTRSFSDYTQKMVEEYGDDIKPYLMSWYLAVRYYPGFDPTGMDTADQINKITSFEDSCN